MKQVKDIMNASPLSCRKDETIQEVSNQMSKSNIGFLPVVDENKKVIGTITDRNIVLAIGKANKAPDKLKVHEAMESTVHTISQEDSADKALEIMRTKQVGRLPVVDSERRLKGVVSLLGIARKIKDSSEKNELGSQGKENIINTLQGIAERNRSTEKVLSQE